MPDLLCRHCGGLFNHTPACALHPSRPCPGCGQFAGDHSAACDRQFDRSDYSALIAIGFLVVLVLAALAMLR